MNRSVRSARSFCFLLLLLLLGVPHGRAIALTQPDGTTIPLPMVCVEGQPFGLPVIFACQCDVAGLCNIGEPCPLGGPPDCDDGQNAVCETTLWHSYGDDDCIPSNSSGLDAHADGAITPTTFMPLGIVSFQLVNRHGIFQSVLCWYNVTGGPPSTADLHPVLSCSAASGDQVSVDFASEPDYLGDRIGFAVISPESHTVPGQCAWGDCCASVARLAAGAGFAYFTESQYNPDYVGPNSVIHMILYSSRMANSSYYIAAEDYFWGGPNTFLSYVVRVDGVYDPESAAVDFHRDRTASGPCLLPSEPNPTRSWTALRFSLPQQGPVRLVIYDIAGRLLRTLVDGELPAGMHRVFWNGKDETNREVPSGCHFAKLSAGSRTATVQVHLVR